MHVVVNFNYKQTRSIYQYHFIRSDYPYKTIWYYQRKIFW